MLGIIGDLEDADILAHGTHLLGDPSEGIGAAEGGLLLRLRGAGRKPEGVLKAVGDTEQGAARLEALVESRRLQRACGGQLLIGIADEEAARVIFHGASGAVVARGGGWLPRG